MAKISRFSVPAPLTPWRAQYPSFHVETAEGIPGPPGPEGPPGPAGPAGGLDRKTVLEFGATGDGVTDDTAAIDAAIAYVNAGTRRSLVFPFGDYLITSALTPIIGIDATILGESARITMGAGAGTNGKIFVVGSSTVNAARCRISGFIFNWANTPNVDDYALDLVQTADSDFSSFIFINAPSLVRYGGDTTSVSRVTCRNWTGTANKGGAADANILIRRGAVGRFEDIHISSSQSGSGGTKAIVKIQPVSGASLDTFWFDKCGFQFFQTSSPPASANGKAYGFYIDRTLGDVTNIWITDCAIDHTTTMGIAFVDATGAVTTPFDRNIKITGNRIATDAGGGILVDFSTPTPSLIVRMATIFNNNVVISDNSKGIEVKGRAAIKGLDVSHNHVQDDNFGTSKTAAISFDCSHFRCLGNQIGGTQTSTGWQTAFQIQHPDCDNFVISDNHAPEVAAFITEPVYTIASDKRIVQHPRSYTVTPLPSPKNIGNMIYVSNETGGAVPAFADGTNWRRVTDRAIVS